MKISKSKKEISRKKDAKKGRGTSRRALAPRERPSWDQYFMSIARLASTRSTCLRRQVGAVIVKDKKILATGYNGAPMGLKHCLDIGCLREELGIPSGERHELCRATHAEQNAIAQAATFGVSIKDGVIYSTTHPCILCSKLLINAGISRIIIEDSYPDEMSSQMLKEAGVKIVVIGQDTKKGKRGKGKRK
ncbi:MAG TPA: cytidine/deoxycytidylate deaminase family protein [Terriglobales bacterium]|nr:cytidine/deoxycytidylate deaminase family protein [Terriglobales bacterium]